MLFPVNVNNCHFPGSEFPKAPEIKEYHLGHRFLKSKKLHIIHIRYILTKLDMISIITISASKYNK